MTTAAARPGREELLRDPAACFDALCREAGDHCPSCGEGRSYRLRDGRERCPGCGYTYHLYSGRWLNRGRLRPADWVRLVDGFAHSVPVREAAARMGIGYDAAHRGYVTIRSAILNHLAGPGRVLDERGEVVEFCPNLEREAVQTLCEGCRAYVFGLYQQPDRTLCMSVIPELRAREVLASPVAKRQWRFFIYTDAYAGCDALVFSSCKRGRELFADSFSDRRVHLDRTIGFAKHLAGLFPGVRKIQPKMYPLYAAEAVFRHGRAINEIFISIAPLLCEFVPKARV